MRKILKALIVSLAISWLFFAPLANARDYDFQDSVDYANFARTWLGLCPKLMNLSSAQLDREYTKMTKEQRETSVKICTPSNQAEVEKFLRYLVSINVFGSFDIEHEEYNLPGTKFKQGEKLDSGIYNYDVVFLNQGVLDLLNVPASAFVNSSPKKFLTTIASEDLINRVTETILTSCKAGSDFTKCNDLLNVADINNNNIFSQTNLSSIYLQQMYYNMLTNASRIPELYAFIRANRIRPPTLSEDFRNDILAPTLEFESKYDFEFKPISINTDALSNVNNHLIPGGLGWFVDATAEISTTMAEGIYKSLISRRLQSIQPDSNMSRAWKSFRNLANVVLILLFIAVIFSQMTNFGLSNYSAKTIIPKLIVGVILVNLSFFLVQMAVDLSNIIGDGLFNLLVDSSKVTGDFAENYAKYQSIPGAIVNLLSIVLLTIAAILTIISSVVNLVLLTIRDVLVVLAVVLSPLALSASVFPVFNSLFKMWLKTLTSALIVFPITSLLIGGSILVDQIISHDGSDDIVTFVVAKLATFGAMILTPFISISALRKADSVLQVGGKGLVSYATPLMPKSLSGTFSQANKTYSKTQFGKYRADLAKQKKITRLASKNGAFWGMAAGQARAQLKKQNLAIAENYSQSDAENIINALYDSPKKPTVTSVNAATQQQFRTDLAKTSRKDYALSLAIAHAKDSSGERQTDALTILKALNVAKQSGASQAEIYSATQQIMIDLDQKGDFRTIGTIKGVNKFFNSYGEFNEDLIKNADQMDVYKKTNDEQTRSLYALIYKETDKAFNERGFHARNKQKAFNQIAPKAIEENSVGREVFLYNLDKNDNLFGTTQNLQHKLSIDVQEELKVSKWRNSGQSTSETDPNSVIPSTPENFEGVSEVEPESSLDEQEEV